MARPRWSVSLLVTPLLGERLPDGGPSRTRPRDLSSSRGGVAFTKHAAMGWILGSPDRLVWWVQ